MIELRNNELVFQFPEVHQKANCQINFQRTLRIPDDNRAYPLPPGLGCFPVEHVDDFAGKLPEVWQAHGGVLIPMYQSEALWINFSGRYPCAVKIAAGKINAVSGEPWGNELSDSPQDYVVVTKQPWLDGFNVSEGYIRQFVAMPLGEGFSAEEQVTGKAEHGGLQIIVYPMKHERFKQFEQELLNDNSRYRRSSPVAGAAADMGLAPGGLMRQKIYEDEYGIDAWDQDNGARCFIHLTNSEQYQAITGYPPPHKPANAEAYTKAGLPWFDYYDDGKALDGSDTLSKLTSVAAKMVEKGKGTLSDNDPVQPKVITKIRKDNVVREGSF